MAADICPVSRKRCDLADVCRLMWCARSPGTPKLKPITEHYLTKDERYALHMTGQRDGRENAG